MAEEVVLVVQRACRALDVTLESMIWVTTFLIFSNMTVLLLLLALIVATTWARAPFIHHATSSQLSIPRGGAVSALATLASVDDEIEKAKKEGKAVVIDFSATWCGPCKMISPVYDMLSDEFENVVFIKVDVDENAETAAKYDVSAMPTFVFIKDGEIVDRLSGANADRLREMIQKLSE